MWGVKCKVKIEYSRGDQMVTVPLGGRESLIVTPWQSLWHFLSLISLSLSQSENKNYREFLITESCWLGSLCQLNRNYLSGKLWINSSSNEEIRVENNFNHKSLANHWLITEISDMKMYPRVWRPETSRLRSDISVMSLSWGPQGSHYSSVPGTRGMRHWPDLSVIYQWGISIHQSDHRHHQ